MNFPSCAREIMSGLRKGCQQGKGIKMHIEKENAK
jgi:hypothetical protein